MIQYDDKYDVRTKERDLTTEQLYESYRVLVPEEKNVSFEKLVGGFSNLTYAVVSPEKTKRIFRVSFSAKPEFENETNILKAISTKRIRSPKLINYAYGHTLNQQVLGLMLMEFEKGVLLNNALSEISQHTSCNIKEKEYQELGECVGIALAEIHSIKVKDDPLLSAMKWDGSLGHSYYEYVFNSLDSDKVKDRLSNSLRLRCKDWVQSNRSLFYEADRFSSLMHNDFNLKNILVAQEDSNWSVSCVLDWEFAEIGTPFVDLGNFLRFEDEMPEMFNRLLS